MNIKSKFSILVAIIFSLSLGLTKVGYSDGHGVWTYDFYGTKIDG